MTGGPDVGAGARGGEAAATRAVRLAVLGAWLLLAVHAVGGEDASQLSRFGLRGASWMGAWRWGWLVGAALACAIPAVRRLVAAVAVHAVGVVASPRGSVVALVTVAVLLAALTGDVRGPDADYLLQLVRSDQLWLWREPLDLRAHAWLVALGARVGVADPAWAYVVASVLAGVAAAAAWWHLACEVGDGDAAPSPLVLAAPVGSGVLLVFAGWIESYALAWAAVAWFLALAARACRDGRGLTAAALVIGTAVALHPVTGTAWPGLVIPLAFALRARDALGRVRLIVQTTLALLVVPATTVAVLLHDAGGYPGFEPLGLGGADLRMFMALDPPAGSRQAVGLLDPRHVDDVVQQVLLVAPVVLLALPLLAQRPHDDAVQRRRALTFALVALGGFALTVVWNPDVGAVGDWDLFSVYALPAAAWLAVEVQRRVPASARADVAVVWAIAGAAVGVPWLLGFRLGVLR